MAATKKSKDKRVKAHNPPPKGEKPAKRVKAVADVAGPTDPPAARQESTITPPADAGSREES